MGNIETSSKRCLDLNMFRVFFKKLNTCTVVQANTALSVFVCNKSKQSAELFQVLMLITNKRNIIKLHRNTVT